MRPSVLGIIGLSVAGCAIGPFGDRVDEDRSAARAAVCIVATGDEGPSTLEDDTGKATVVTEGTGCTRRFLLDSTAARRDDLPRGPREVTERSDRANVQTKSPLFDALFQLALDEAAENSVGAIRDGAFNNGADLTCPAGGCFETGRKWTYVWTRDTSYSADLGLGWVDPIRAMNSLELKLSARRDGTRPEIVQDTGTGGSYPISTDRAVWALGAAETLQHLHGTARARFRDVALEAAKNTIEHDRAVVFDSRDGLYRGEQSFLDWREQTYPSWTVPDLAHIGMSKSLSTNLAHLSLLELAASLARETGDDATATTMRSRGAALRTAIRARFWLPEDEQLSTFVPTELDQAPVRRFDLLGTSLAVLLDAVPAAEARAAIASYPTFAKGPPVVFPQQQQTAIYHNRAIWPFVTAYWSKAAKKVGNDAAFDAAVQSLVRGAALNLSNMENLEAVSGRPFVEDGPFSGPVVNSQRQLWSVAGYIGTVVGGVFGVEAVDGGVKIAPYVTRGLRRSVLGGSKSIVLNALPLRSRRLSVVVNLPDDTTAGGGAYAVKTIRLNGAALEGNFASDADLPDNSLFEVDLAAEALPAAQVRTITDVSDYRTFYGPRTPAITSLDVDGDKLALKASFGGEDGVTWSVYRDGQRVATGLSSTNPTWTDQSTNGDASPSHCYTIETRFTSSGNVSQHAAPACFWGSGSSRVRSVPASEFEVSGGSLVTSYGRTFHQFWGDPGHAITATFTASRTGAHLVQAVYGNGAGSMNTGITCAVKHAVVEEADGGKVAGDGYLLMPQRGDWASWGDSSFVRANLVAGKRYRVTLAHDDRAANMSAFAHFDAYTGGLGGRSGPFFRVNIAELKLLAL